MWKQSVKLTKEVQTAVPESVDACTQSSDHLALHAAVSEPRRRVVIDIDHTTSAPEQLTLEERLKRYGCSPLLPAGPRHGSNVARIDIDIGATDTLTWPPLGWEDHASNNKLWAAQTVIALREIKRNNGMFPDGDMAEYLRQV